MAKQRITGRDGTTTVISDSYAPHGTIVTGPPTPVEDPTRWQPKTLPLADVAKRYGGASADELLMAWPETAGFPKPAKVFTSSQFFAWQITRSHVWTEDSLVAWEDMVRGIAARLPKKR